MSALLSPTTSPSEEARRLLDIAISNCDANHISLLKETLCDLDELFNAVATQRFFDGLAGSHVFNHQVPAPPRFNVKVEKNSKSFNFEITVIGAESVSQALALGAEARTRLQAELEPVTSGPVVVSIPASPDARPVPTVPSEGV